MKKKIPEVPIWAKNGLNIWYEIRDKNDIEIIEYKEAIITYADHDTNEIKVKLMDTAEEITPKPDHYHIREEEHKIIQNLSEIPTLNDAELLKHLEMRYVNNLIHCYCGLTLIVINPYKSIEHEESPELKSTISKYLIAKNLTEAPPHVWTIAATSWYNLFVYG